MSSTARGVALEIINKANSKGSYANLLLPKVLEKSRLSPRDKALATQLAYGTLRSQGTLDWLIMRYAKKDNKIKPKVMDILRLGAYQVYYLDRVPDSAAVNNAVELSKAHYPKRVSDFVNAVLRKVSRNKNKVSFNSLKKDFAQYLSIKYSHPLWIAKLFLETYGKRKAEAMCKANSEVPDINIRVNTMRISVDAYEKLLIKKGYKVKRSKLCKDSMIIKPCGSITGIFGYAEGLFTVQDQSSTLVGHVLNPKPGESIIDVAAAPGGKTAHMASLMKNKGTIIATDVSSARLSLLDSLRDRMKLKIIIPLAVDTRRLNLYVKRTVNKVLVDAPCSGLGTLARRPDERWRKTEKTIHVLSQLQLEMLDSVADLVKKGGDLVYSVCTVTKEETEGVVEDFLAYHPEFKLVDIKNELPAKMRTNSKYGIQILPHQFHSDGMFIAKFNKIKRTKLKK
ncbi:hypothetical protein LCGC14_1074120 [marine sediment metagenome]|uniref:16S rRNA (cytosine(967)-C(5))-methyltransferase n=1 Tax=marine sediment metagenome TaxID=412755 RepID=A0A0F9Q0B8_9ZZZZ